MLAPLGQSGCPDVELRVSRAVEHRPIPTIASSHTTPSPSPSRMAATASLRVTHEGSPRVFLVPPSWQVVAAPFPDVQERVLVVTPAGTLSGRNIVSSCS